MNVHMKIKWHRYMKLGETYNLALALRRLRSSVALLCLVLFACAVHAQQAPLFKLPGADSDVELTAFKGQVVYLDFWASWCGPCRKSFPWMNEMQNRYGEQGFSVVSVNLDSDRAQAERFLKEVPAEFVVAFDSNGRAAELYSLQVMPTSYLIDRDGQLVSIHRGFRLKDKAKIETEIKELVMKK